MMGISAFNLGNRMENYDEVDAETATLRAYLLPENNESFSQYQKRFIDTFGRPGFKRLLKLVLSKKLPIKLEFSNDGDKLIVDTDARERQYTLKIGVSGAYENRGNTIAKGFLEHLEENQLQNEYRTIDKLI
jgi:hypothetical protein